MRLSCFSSLCIAFLLLPVGDAAQTTAPAAEVPVPKSTASPPPAEAVAPPPASTAGLKFSDAEMETFLQTAKLVARKKSNLGTTAPVRATLSDGKLTHDAQVQCIDDYRPVWKGAEGTVEKNFRDSWKYNIAAYRVARLLDIDMVPMSVERELDGKLCAFTWWVDNVWLVEVERRDKGIKPPATDSWVNQLNTIRVFDQLIYNTDRNQGNLLITPEWKVWMIDHTRAFRVSRTLLKADTLRRIDSGLLKRLKTLTRKEVSDATGAWLRQEEIDGLMARRDEIVSYFSKEVREKGEEAVLTGLPRTTPQVSVP